MYRTKITLHGWCKEITWYDQCKETSMVWIIPRVPDQNGVSLLHIMLEIYHSSAEPSI